MIAGGRPAAFFNQSSDLFFKRANDANGDSWPLGASAISNNADFYDGAATVNGKPAAAYVEVVGLNQTLRYLQAIDDNGTSWFPAEEVETGTNALDLAVLKAFGSPEHACIAYRVGSGEIRFARKN